MKFLLAVRADTGLAAESPASQDIDIYSDNELDGPNLVKAVFDAAPYLPIIAGSTAASLAALNKAIDEMRTLVKRFLKKSPPEDDRSGVFENGRRVLNPASTEAEIDAYFAEFKARAAKARPDER